MTNEIDKALTAALTGAIGKKIDVAKLADRIAPKIERLLETHLVKSFEAKNIGDQVAYAMSRAFEKEAEQLVIRAMKKLR